MFLITGLSSSGTLYITKVLQALGLRVRHERPGGDGIVSWFEAPEAAREKAEQLQKRGRYGLVLHQVREPLKVITTLQYVDSQSRAWEFLCKAIGCEMSDPLLLRTMKYWLGWTDLADLAAGPGNRYRIESLPECFEWFCGKVGATPDRSVLEGLSTETHTRRRALKITKDLGWDDLYAEDACLAACIQAKAREYGYEGW